MKKKVLLFTMLQLLLGIPIAYSQLNYTAASTTNTTGAYTDFGANGTIINTANFDDDNSAPQNIGFTFHFNGLAFTQFVLNTNGFIKLGSTAPSKAALFGSALAMTNGAIASSHPLDVNIIAAINANLQAGTATPEYRMQTTGSAGTRICTIQFKNVRDKDTTVQFNNMNFQIKLYEGTNVIELVFGKWEASTNATIARFTSLGLKGSDSTAAQVLRSQKSSSTAWSGATFLTNLTGNGHNLRNNILPDSGRIYRFTPIPLKATIPATSVCTGLCNTIKANANSGIPPYTYSWSTGQTISAIEVCPTTSTTYSVAVTDAVGSTASATITVSISPIPTITASGNTICAGGQGTLSASGGTTYTWLGGTNSSTGSIVTASPSVTTTYTVIGANSASCTNSSTAAITVNSQTAPAVILSLKSDTVCAGEPIQVCASGANSYSWTPIASATANDLSCTTCSCVTIKRSGATGTFRYVVIGKDTIGGCVAKPDTFTLRINALPTLLTSSSTICIGGSGQVSASGASAYSWTDGITPTAGAILVASPTVTTTYTVTGVNTNGCSATATARIVVGVPVTITATGSSMCLGGTGMLSASGATTYTWTGGTSPTTGAIVSATPTVTTSYTVTGTASGCTNSATAIITVIQQNSPIVTLSAKYDTICAGGSVQVCASGTSTFTWTAISPALAGDISCANCSCTNLTHTAGSNGTFLYVVNGKDANGCASKNDTVFLRMYALPTLVASGSTICTGALGQLTVSGASTYTWSSGTTPNTGNSVVASPTITTTYTVTGTSNRGCIGTATASIVVNQGVAPVITTSWKRDTVCSGTPTQICASGAGTYTWAAVPNASANDISSKNTACTNLSHTGLGIFRYTVIGTDTANGCRSSMDTVFLYIDPVITVTGATICNGSTAVISASGAATYSWSAGTTPSTGPVVSVSPTTTSNYTVTVSSVNGCTGTGRATVIVNALPNVTTSWTTDSICIDSLQQVCASGATSYSWSPISPAVSANISSPLTACTNLYNGTIGTFKYKVIGKNAAGCQSLPDTVTIITYKCLTDVKNTQTPANFFTAYVENGSSNFIQVRYSSMVSESFNVECYDLLGKLIYTQSFTKAAGRFEEKLAVNEMPTGILLLVLKTPTKNYSIKLVRIQ